MADFTDRMAMGTNRVNPSSMIPGSRGNAPQVGATSQMRRPAAPMADTGGSPSNAQRDALMQQLRGGMTSSMVNNMMNGNRRVQLPSAPLTGEGGAKPTAVNEQRMKRQSELPAEAQRMLPSRSEKKSYKADDFAMLSDVFKLLSER